MTNEAAKTLRSYLNATATVRGIAHYRAEALRDLDKALAAERRATVVELIRQMKDGELPGSTGQEKAGIQYAALWLGKRIADEEAAR